MGRLANQPSIVTAGTSRQIPRPQSSPGRGRVFVTGLHAPPMARDSALVTGFTSFLTGPLVSGALLMSRLAAHPRDLAPLDSIHRRKSTISVCHDAPYPRPRFAPQPARQFTGLRSVPSSPATAVPRFESACP